MTLVCITNDMDDARSCTVRDNHTTACDGFEYRMNARRGREEATGRTCKGCLPREAQKGLLCWGCWSKVETAFAEWTTRAEAFLSIIDRAVQRDNGGIRSGPEGYVPIPGTALAVDEINSYLKSMGTSSADVWVSNPVGAADAVRFARAVPAALRTHELEERAHRVTRVRCPECKQTSLVWKPPGAADQHVEVRCQNTGCRATISQTATEVEHERQVHGVETPIIEAGAPVTLDHNHAEAFDPELPEHEGFDRLTTHPLAELREMAEALDISRAKSLRKTDLITAIRTAQLKETA